MSFLAPAEYMALDKLNKSGLELCRKSKLSKGIFL